MLAVIVKSFFYYGLAGVAWICLIAGSYKINKELGFSVILFLFYQLMKGYYEDKTRKEIALHIDKEINEIKELISRRN